MTLFDIIAFWRVCRFQAGPELIPPSFLILVIILNALISFGASWILQSSLPPAESVQVTPEQIATIGSPLAGFTRVSVRIVVTSFLVWGMLGLMGHDERVIRKTLTALFGADAVLTTLTLIAGLIILSTSSMVAIVSMVALFFFFWTVAVFGFILHRATSIGIGLGVVAGYCIMSFAYAVERVIVGL